MTTKALIIGGGIGGLTAALSLHAAGVETTVYESVSDIQALGVGINVLPHAVRILHGLGLREALERTAIITSTLRFHSRQGQTIWAEPRGVEAGYDYPQYSIHRGQLQAALLDAVRQRLGDERYSCRTSSGARGTKQRQGRRDVSSIKAPATRLANTKAMC